MSNLKDIRNRIRSVKEVHKITHVMKMVAAAKLKKTEERLNQVKNFYARIEAIIFRAYSFYRSFKSDLFMERPILKTGILLLSGDRGLCGSFNQTVLKKALQLQEQAQGKDCNCVFFGIGKKGNHLLERSGLSIIENIQDIFGSLTMEKSKQITEKIIHYFREGSFDRMLVSLNQFKTKAEDQTQLVPLLPLSFPESFPYKVQYIFEPYPEKLFAELTTYYLNLKVYRFLLESGAAELLARMLAMESATKNAEELIHQLTLDYNQERQSVITTEIIDIVGGAEALRV